MSRELASPACATPDESALSSGSSTDSAELDSTMPPPSKSKEPASGQWKGRPPGNPCRIIDAVMPAIEPHPRGARVDPEMPQSMLPCILEDVRERALHLERRTQNAREIPIGEDRALVPERPLDPLRHADGQALHPTRQALLPARLHEEMEVVRLHRELADQHAKPLGTHEDGVAHHAKNPPRAKTRQSPHDFHRNMNGTASRELPPFRMRDPRRPTLGLPSRALPCTAPLRKEQTRQSSLHRAHVSSSSQTAVGLLPKDRSSC